MSSVGQQRQEASARRRCPREFPRLSFWGWRRVPVYRPYGTQQQTRRTPLLLSIDGTDRQTDGRTLDRFIIVNPGVPLTLILCFLSSNLYLYFIAIVWIQHVLLPYQTKRFDFEWTLLRTLYTYIRVYMERVCVQPRPSAVNMTLPAFAGERRAAAPLSIYFSCSALSSKLVASHCCCRSIG